MRVIVGCEFSGEVRRAFAARGHDAWSCDLLPSDDVSPNHITGDVLSIIGDGWDLGIFHPPCTYLCNSGVRWLFGGKGTTRDPVRWKKMEDAAGFFSELLNAPIPAVALENPVMHRYARERIGRNFDCSIQPWQFGHGEVKRTCLWLRGLPPLRPTRVVDGRIPRVHFMSPGQNRGHERSRTLPGIAAAMADQWGQSIDSVLLDRVGKPL